MYESEDIVFPNTLQRIGGSAFYGCTSLTSIVIPKAVFDIGTSVFEGCINLKSIKVEEGNTRYDSRENCNGIIEKDRNILIAGCLKTVIPYGVASIRTFSCCTGLKEIVIPNSVKEIENCAFQGCTGLGSLVIPDSVTKIGWNAFRGCTGLTRLTIPSTVRIDDGAFEDCTALSTVEIKGEMKPFPERMIWENEDQS